MGDWELAMDNRQLAMARRQGKMSIINNKVVSCYSLFRIFNSYQRLEKNFIFYHSKTNPYYELETYLRSFTLWTCNGDCYCFLDTDKYRMAILAGHLHFLRIPHCLTCTGKLFSPRFFSEPR